MNAKMKIIIFLVVLASVAILNGYQCSQKSEASMAFLLKREHNLDALASDEIANGFYRNFKSATVWYNSDISGGIAVNEKPGFWVSGNWKSMVCCVNATDMDACNFPFGRNGMRKESCKKFALRNFARLLIL